MDTNMKNKVKKTLLIPGAVTLCLGMFSCTALAGERTAVAHQAQGTVAIDGDLSEWDLSSPIEIKEASQVIRDEDYWLGETDVSASVYLMWDAENLYLAVDAKEATPFGAVGQLAHNMEDNFKLYISTNPDADPERTSFETNDFLVYLMMDKINWYTAIDRSMIERENLARFSTQGMEGSDKVLQGYETAYTITEGGFIFEAVIPWANFSNDYIEAYAPAAGDTVNFNFAITDNDYPFPNTQASVQMSWCGTAEIDKNPSLWGQVTFE